MGANHIEPGNHTSSIARWLYCDAPVDAYTLHAYDWVSRDRPGDMPIDWDLDNIVAQPCPNGRTLPVIVEELGTSRELAGMYTATQESARLDQERRQIAFVRQFPQVIGFGVWNGESPRLADRTFVDVRRGLTSYGSDGRGGGSCYDPMPALVPGARCQLEQVLRGSLFVRVGESSEWSPVGDADTTDPLVGAVDPVADGRTDAGHLTLTGWVGDASEPQAAGLDSLDVLAMSETSVATRLASAQLGQSRRDHSGDGFKVDLPLGLIPQGTTQLVLAAHSRDRGAWVSTVQVVVPTLGSVPPYSPPVAKPVPVPVEPRVQLKAEIQSPSPGALVSRTFGVQVLAPNADRVDVFLEPDRDRGGRLVGSASSAERKAPGATFSVTVTAPPTAQTLFVHVSFLAGGHEEVLTLPVVIG
jgi:hypothetical protein